MFTVLGTIWHLHVETRKEPESIIGHNIMFENIL